MEFDPTTMKETCRQLAEEIGPDGVAELLESYLADTPNRLAEIGRFLESPDQTSLKRAAHSLKGSSSIFGLSEMESIANRLEHSFATGELESQTLFLRQLREEFERCRGSLVATAAELAAMG
jgi:HPt (histidine-containing phosphotransfer) domain-containing protein